LALNPALKAEGLQGGFSFFDAQMDDHALGLWAARQAEKAGVALHEAVKVVGLDTSGNLQLDNESRHFDHIVNVAGPWAQQLLERSGISSAHSLDLVRGSHIMFADECPFGCFLQVPAERRIFFVLPYQGKTLVGTTEVRQAQPDSVRCSSSEIQYLLDAYNFYFLTRKTLSDVVDSFSGLRPLVRSAEDPGQATREYAIERVGQLITVFGGKWTTARQLGWAVARQVGALE
jgi:glycerol-3-phosphate dehydrogenase